MNIFTFSSYVHLESSLFGTKPLFCEISRSKNSGDNPSFRATAFRRTVLMENTSMSTCGISGFYSPEKGLHKNWKIGWNPLFFLPEFWDMLGCQEIWTMNEDEFAIEKWLDSQSIDKIASRCEHCWAFFILILKFLQEELDRLKQQLKQSSLVFSNLGGVLFVAATL